MTKMMIKTKDKDKGNTKWENNFARLTFCV